MKKQLFFIIYLFCFLIYVANAQDSKPKVKPKPATTTKPPVVKTQPKTNTTQTDNKYGTVTDIDGNVYKTVKIGNQIWMAENLKTTRYNDGTPIPNVTDNYEWRDLTTGAFSFYHNDYINNAIYGILYNWYAVETSKLAPKGWHIPSDKEWQQLINYLGGSEVAGGKMKSTKYWQSPNLGASNSSGFNGLPAGYRYSNGTFTAIGYNGYFWSSTENFTHYAWNRFLDYSSLDAYRLDLYKQNGFSVRCVRD